MEARLYFNETVQIVVKFDPETDAYEIINEADGKSASGTIEEGE